MFAERSAGIMPKMGETPSQQMQCMEVWGGNQLTSGELEFGGSDAWIYTKPYGQAHSGGFQSFSSGAGFHRVKT